jgi:DNA-binding beta-propeller fold protein YncE
MRGSAMRKIGNLTALTAAFMAVSAAPAYATTTERLNLPGFGAIAVDQAHKHLFVSGGATSNSVVVTDFSGHEKKTIDKQYGASGLVLSADGKLLYVALAAGDAISAIDTKTLKETARYDTGAQTCPTHLARTGTSIWFGHGCGDRWAAGIGRVDPTTTPPAIQTNLQGSGVNFPQAPLLAAAPAATSLVAGQTEVSLSTAYVFDVTSGAPTLRTSSDAPGSDLADAAVSADGLTLFTAARSRRDVPAFDTTAFAGRGAYTAGLYPVAVTPSPDGRRLALGVQNPGDDVVLYKVGESDPTRRIDLGEDIVAPRGLAWSGDSKRLFAVTQGPAGGAPTLRVAVS